MNKEDLIKANKIKTKIDELEGFIHVAENVWSGKLTIKNKIMSFISNPYGIFKQKELELNTELKNKVLNFVIEYKKELEKELEKI